MYRHPTKPGTVTIAGHLRDDLHPNTLKRIRCSPDVRGCVATGGPSGPGVYIEHVAPAA